MAHAHCMLDTLVYKHTLRICNTAFPLQQWSHERTSMLRYTYIACIVWNIRGKFGADPKAFWILGSTNVITATCVQTQWKHMKNVSMMLIPPKTGTAGLPTPETMWRPTGLPTYISRPLVRPGSLIKCHKWQRGGSRSIHLLILNWRQRGWVVKGTPRPLYPQERAPVHIAHEAGWAQGRSERLWRRKNFLPPPRFEARTVQLVASLYTDYAILTPTLWCTVAKE